MFPPDLQPLFSAVIEHGVSIAGQLDPDAPTSEFHIGEDLDMIYCVATGAALLMKGADVVLRSDHASDITLGQMMAFVFN